MLTRRLKTIGATTTALALAGWVAGSEPTSALAWLPHETVFAVEIGNPSALLEPLLSPAVLKSLESLPAWQQRAASPQFAGLARVVNHLARQLGTDGPTALRRLTSGGLMFALGPTGGAVLCLEMHDAATANQVLQSLQPLLLGVAARRNAPLEQWDRHGVTVSSLGPTEAHAVVGHRLLIANGPIPLNRVIDARAGSAPRKFAEAAPWQEARRALGRDPVASAFVDLRAVRLNPKFQKGLAKSPDPLQALLFHEVQEAVRKGRWLAAGVFIKDGTLSLKLVADGTAPAAGSFTRPPAPPGGLRPILTVPDGLASASFHRDLREFYAAKDELFPERTSGLIFFENMMGIFFSGLHLTEGVLAEFHPDIRVVAATQHYDPAIGTPAVKVPAFAAVLRLKHPQEFGDAVEEAWQKFIGLQSFTRGQKAQPGFIIDRIPHGDVKMTVAAFRPPTGPDRNAVDVRYNFRPTLARTGDHVILSSTDGLARQLIEAVKTEAANPGRPLPGLHSLVEVQGAGVLGATLVNREQIARKNMIEKGASRAQAEGQVQGLLALLDCVRHGRLALGRENGHPVATLDLKLQAPEPGRLSAVRRVDAGK